MTRSELDGGCAVVETLGGTVKVHRHRSRFTLEVFFSTLHGNIWFNKISGGCRPTVISSRNMTLSIDLSVLILGMSGA